MKRLCATMSVLLSTTLSVGCGGELPTGADSELDSGAGASESNPVVALASYCDGNTGAASSLEIEVLNLVNAQRAKGATCGSTAMPKVGALSLNAELLCASRLHSKDMSAKNFMSHTGSNGSSPFQRMTNAGYTWRAAAENVAAGHATAQAVVDGWMKSEGHCKNIMGGGYAHLGVGYSYSASTTYKHYWTQNFGNK